MKQKNNSIYQGMKSVFIFFSAVIIFLNGFPSFAARQEQHSYIDTGKIEKGFLELINKERKKRGLQVLLDHPVLSRVSLKHSLKMAQEEELNHEFPYYKSLGGRLKEAGLLFRKAGENIAYCKPYLLDIVHDGFMESPSHRENILDPDFTHCSIKIAKKNRDLYITQEFIQLSINLEKNTVIAALQEELASRFKKKFKFPLTFLPVANEFAELCAKENLMGRKVNSFRKEWGNFYVVNLISPRINELKKELRKKTGTLKYEGAAIGAAVGINPDYPGGTYAITAFLFPGNKYRKKSEEQLRKYVLEEVNKMRVYRRCQVLKYSKALSQVALETAQRYYNHRQEFNYPGARHVLVFQTDDPRRIPAKIKPVLTTHEHGGKTGVAVFSPIRYGLPGNFFIVAIIISN